MLLPGLLHELLAEDAARTSRPDPLAPRPAHFPAKAKNVIFLFMTGGVSHIDTFDPKPKLHADVGREVKLDHPEIQNRPGYEHIYLIATAMGVPYRTAQSGTVSERPSFRIWPNAWTILRLCGRCTPIIRTITTPR